MIEATAIVERLATPLTFREAPKREAAFRDAAFADVKTFRVAMFAWVRTVMLVALAVAAFRVVTLVVERFEVPVMFMSRPKSETAFITKAFPLVKTFRVAMFAWVPTVMLVALAVATFRVVTFVVERLEVPVMFMSPPKSDTAFIINAFPLVKTFRVEMFARVWTVKMVPIVAEVATLSVATFVVNRFEVPETFMLPPNSEAAFIAKAFALVKTFRIAMFAWVRTVMLVALAVATFMVVTFVVERLEIPVMFMEPPKIEAVFRVVTFVVERFEVSVTFIEIKEMEDTDILEILAVPLMFIFVPKIEAAFREVTFVVERFEVPVMFMSRPKSETAFITKAFPLVKTFRVAMLPWVRTVMLVALAVATFMVVTFVVERLEIPVMFMSPPKSDAAFITKAFPRVKTFRVAMFARVPTVMLVRFAVIRFEVPVTFMFVPKREAALRVVAFVVERFEVPVTFRVDVEKVVAFKVVTLVVDKLETAVTLRVALVRSGMATVSKKNTVFVAFDVKPLATRLFVQKVLETFAS